MAANTVTPGQPSLVTLNVQLNNGQSYPVQFALPPGKTQDMGQYATVSNLANYVSNSLNFDSASQYKVLSLSYRIADARPFIYMQQGNGGQITSLELMSATEGVSGTTGANIAGGDLKGQSLFYSISTGMPTFNYQQYTSSVPVTLLATQPGSNDFFNSTPGSVSTSNNTQYSSCVGVSVNGVNSGLQGSFNLATAINSLNLGISKSGTFENILSLDETGTMTTKRGNTVLESVGNTAQMGVQAFRVTGSGGNPTINFPKAFSGIPVVTAMTTREPGGIGGNTRGVVYDLSNGNSTQPNVTATGFQIQIYFNTNVTGDTVNSWAVDVIAVGPI